MIRSTGFNSAPWGDGLAIGAALLCLAHCLALPLVLALLPTLFLTLPVPGQFHAWMIAATVPLSFITLASAFRRCHTVRPLVLGGSGLALMACGLVLPTIETPLTVAGSVMVVLAHSLNWWLGRD